MTRQRKWQLRMRKQGRCTVCAAEANGKPYCPTHRAARTLRQRTRLQRVAQDGHADAV